MLIVHQDAPNAPYAPYDIADAPVVGLLTLEDVLEELIQADIHDETDVAHDSPVAGCRRKKQRARLNHLVALYEARYGCVPGSLTDAESAAVAAFLAARVPSLFGQLAQHDGIMQGLLRACELVVVPHDSPMPPVDTIDRCSSGATVPGSRAPTLHAAASLPCMPDGRSASLRTEGGPRAEGPLRPGSGGLLEEHEGPWGQAQGWLYQQGQPSVACTVILQVRNFFPVEGHLWAPLSFAGQGAGSRQSGGV